MILIFFRIKIFIKDFSDHHLQLAIPGEDKSDSGINDVVNYILKKN